MLDSLRIKNFRCFEDLEIESLGRVNLIVGRNSVGKTTLLEAVDLLTCDSEKSVEKMVSILQRRGQATENQTVDFSKLIFNKKNGESYQLKEKDNTFHIGDLSGENTITISPELDYVAEPLPKRSSYGSFVPSYIEEGKKLSRIWDEIYLNSDDVSIYDFLKTLTPDITSLAFTGESQRTCYIKTKSQGALPMMTYGEGTGRLLQIAFHLLMAKNSCLMIDEFENGLHYSIQEEVWQKLFKLAAELDIQIFATTHSKDTLESFYNVALDNPTITGNVISLGKSVAKSEEGKIFATVFGEKSGGIELLEQTGIEVR